MRRLTLLVFGFASFYAPTALSDTARNPMPASCKEKQSVQLLSSGDPVEGDTSKITCTVRYWVCGQNFTQTQVAPNQPGAYERFTGWIRRIRGEACCDCFPKCAASDAPRRKPPATETAGPVKGDCCGKLDQLEPQVRQLEARLQAQEEKLSDERSHGDVVGSYIRLEK